MTVYVGTANSQGRGDSNVTHRVVDTEKWLARCGKAVAEAYEVTLEQAYDEVTCRSCNRAYR